MTVLTADGEATHRAQCEKTFEIEEETPETAYECRVLDLLPIAGKDDTYSITVDASATPADGTAIVSSVIDITGPNS